MKRVLLIVALVVWIASAAPAAEARHRRGHCEPFRWLTRVQCITAGGLKWVWDEPRP